jgi:uncharacterized membrane protein YeaQ/YmgE (transglycosylase-associated protein family)
MTLEMFGLWIGVGLIAGYLAGYVTTEGGYGLLGDLGLGVIGSLVAGGLFLALGNSPGAGLVVVGVVAFIGAALVIGGQRILWTAHA